MHLHRKRREYLCMDPPLSCMILFIPPQHFYPHTHGGPLPDRKQYSRVDCIVIFWQLFSIKQMSHSRLLPRWMHNTSVHISSVMATSLFLSIQDHMDAWLANINRLDRLWHIVCIFMTIKTGECHSAVTIWTFPLWQNDDAQIYRAFRIPHDSRWGMATWRHYDISRWCSTWENRIWTNMSDIIRHYDYDVVWLNDLQSFIVLKDTQKHAINEKPEQK